MTLQRSRIKMNVRLSMFSSELNNKVVYLIQLQKWLTQFQTITKLCARPIWKTVKCSTCSAPWRRTAYQLRRTNSRRTIPMLGICQPDACCGSRLASPISAQLTSGRSCPSISGSGTPVTCNFINKQQFPYLGLGAHIYIYTHIYMYNRLRKFRKYFFSRRNAE